MKTYGVKLIIFFFFLSAVIGCTQVTQDIGIKPKKSGYVKVDHGQLFYQKFGAGEPIVIVHGGPGGDMSYLLPQMLELAKDHELIFYDQRGSGKSLDTVMNTRYINVNKFTEDLERLRAALGLKKFILLGHSWGGFLSMNYAIKHRKHLSALILVDSVPASYEGQSEFIASLNERIKPIKEEVSAIFKYDELAKLSEAEIHKLFRTFFSIYLYDKNDASKININMSKASVLSGTKVAEFMSATYMKPGIDLLPALKSLNTPTLVIHGREDVIPLHTAQKIKDAMPKAEMVTLDQCGHSPFVEKPAELFAAIRAFLDKKIAKAY